MRLERDDRSRRADEPSAEKREETNVGADVEEDRARLDEPFERVLDRELGLPRRPDRRRLVEEENEALRGPVRDRDHAAVERTGDDTEYEAEDGREHRDPPRPVDYSPGNEVEHE